MSNPSTTLCSCRKLCVNMHNTNSRELLCSLRCDVWDCEEVLKELSIVLCLVAFF